VRPKERPSVDWAEKLGTVAKVRAPFATCARKIVSNVVRRWLPERGTLVEVGAGSGQLRGWLEGDLERWIHTEPDRAALAEFRETFPEAKVLRTGIEGLPFADGEIGAVAGLCVLDILADLPNALGEAFRVLNAEGRLVHLLDLSPHRAALLAELSAAEKLALPNLFGDPLAKEWPEDLLITEQRPMRLLLEALERVDHPLPKVFQRYFAAAFRKPFDAESACTELDVISRTEAMRELLRQSLFSAYEVGYRSNLEPPLGSVLSSGFHFAVRLHEAATEAGFVVEVNEIRGAWAHAPLVDASVRHRCLALGQGRLASAAAAPCLCEDAKEPSSEHELVEYGMLVFVARKPNAGVRVDR
jgi:SAM-dependent methyltransferase